MKKNFKWMLKGFLFLFLTAGVYFYFFPTYPDYGISEEYFETIHYGKDINSEEDGRNILLGFSQAVGEGELLGDYIEMISDLESKEYITSLNSEESLSVLEGLKSINKIIESKDELYFYTIFLIDTLNKFDSNLVESTVLMDLIYENTRTLSENTQQTFPSLRNKIIENAVRHEYHYISSELLGQLSNVSTFKSKLFYDEIETRKLLLKQFHSSILRQKNPHFKLNGHNYIGRILIDTLIVDYQEYFDREEELREHIHNYNILLSN